MQSFVKVTALIVLGSALPALSSADELQSNGRAGNLSSQMTASPLQTASPGPDPDDKTVPQKNPGWWSSHTKEDKLLYTNLTAAAAIGLWGLATWDYGSAGFHGSHEGWFEYDSKYGGADKLGHFWATYAFSDALTCLYKDWG